jgi:hypothetical protein
LGGFWATIFIRYYRLPSSKEIESRPKGRSERPHQYIQRVDGDSTVERRWSVWECAYVGGNLSKPEVFKRRSPLYYLSPTILPREKYIMEYVLQLVTTLAVVVLILYSIFRHSSAIRDIPGPPSPSWIFGTSTLCQEYCNSLIRTSDRTLAAAVTVPCVWGARVKMAQLLWVRLLTEGLFRRKPLSLNFLLHSWEFTGRSFDGGGSSCVAVYLKQSLLLSCTNLGQYGDLTFWR